MWLFASAGSALFAGITAILAKLGIQKTDSDVATVIRTIVVLVFAWIMAALTGQIGVIGSIQPTSWLFLGLSGMATGASWICYFKALSIGDVNKVVPIDKCSAVLTILLAIALFGETNALPLKLVCSALILVGTLMMVERKASAGGGANQRGKLPKARPAALDRRELAFICLSGVATGASWLCYYYAIQHGVVSVVVPIDKLSALVSMGFAYFVFHERYTKRSLAGLALITCSTLAMAVWA